MIRIIPRLRLLRQVHVQEHMHELLVRQGRDSRYRRWGQDGRHVTEWHRGVAIAVSNNS